MCYKHDLLPKGGVATSQVAFTVYFQVLDWNKLCEYLDRPPLQTKSERFDGMKKK